MVVEFLLAFFIFRYLRKSLQTSILLPKWDRILLIGMIASISLIVVEAALDETRPYVMWMAHGLMLFIIFLIYREKEFKPARSLMLAVLPYIILSFIGDAVELASPSFYRSWDEYFDIAKVFAVIWMVVMWIITNKQNKALAKEKQKTQEEEKQTKIMKAMKAELEIQVAERTSEITKQKEELQHALNDLKSTQEQLIHSEKMASLGELTAGIAHEIQNPLNFVNNFSEVNTELIEELQQEIAKAPGIQWSNLEEIALIANDIRENEKKINHHGKRADSIVKGMLQHSRKSTGQKEPTDINAMVDEYLRLSFHGLRAKDKSFNAKMVTDLDPTIGKINIIPQDVDRVLLNLYNNAFYTVTEKKKMLAAASVVPEKSENMSIKTIADKYYEPTVSVSTKNLGDRVEIRVKDNGNGIPRTALDKIFQPFFTTKPTGEGTGLGLSLSYDIITKVHGGELKVITKEGKGSVFVILLPAK